MSIQRVTIIALIILILFGSWQFYRWKYPNFQKRILENAIEFQEKEQRLNELVLIVGQEIKDRNFESKILKIEQMSPLLREKMEDVGFSNITLSKAPLPCDSKLVLIFEVFDEWNSTSFNRVEVIFSPCDNATEKGHHWFDGYHIDIRGQGNNWKILTDTDFI